MSGVEHGSETQEIPAPSPSVPSNGDASSVEMAAESPTREPLKDAQEQVLNEEEEFGAYVDEAPAYIIVSDKEDGNPVELPLELDHALLVNTLQIEYTGAIGVKYRNPDSGIFRVIAPKDGRLLPPPGGWGSHYFIACCPRAVDDRPWMINEPLPPLMPSPQLKRPLPPTNGNQEPPVKRPNLPAGLSDVNSTPIGSGQDEPSKGPGPIAGPSFDFCKVCNIELNSQTQADAHYKGKKHIDKMSGAARGRGGPPRAGRGGPPSAGRGGPPSAGRGGPPNAGRGGPPGAGRGGAPRGFGGPPARGGGPMRGRGGGPMGGPRGGPPRGGGPGRGFQQRGGPRGGGRGGGGDYWQMNGGHRNTMGGLLDGNNGYQSFGQTARQMFDKSDFANDTPTFDFSRGGRKFGGNFASSSSAPYGGY